MGKENLIEENLIKHLTELKYIYRPNIVDRKTLELNFKNKFEALNRVRLTDIEFLRLREEIINPDVFAASKLLRERQYFQREDDTPLHYTLVNNKDWKYCSIGTTVRTVLVKSFKIKCKAAIHYSPDDAIVINAEQFYIKLKHRLLPSPGESILWQSSSHYWWKPSAIEHTGIRLQLSVRQPAVHSETCEKLINSSAGRPLSVPKVHQRKPETISFNITWTVQAFVNGRALKL